MHTSSIASPRWSTSSFGNTVDTSSTELTALGEHLDRCHALRGRLFDARCVAESMHGFVASRFVTTLVVATLLIGVSSLIL